MVLGGVCWRGDVWVLCGFVPFSFVLETIRFRNFSDMSSSVANTLPLPRDQSRTLTWHTCTRPVCTGTRNEHCWNVVGTDVPVSMGHERDLAEKVFLPAGAMHLGDADDLSRAAAIFCVTANTPIDGNRTDSLFFVGFFFPAKPHVVVKTRRSRDTYLGGICRPSKAMHAHGPQKSRCAHVPVRKLTTCDAHGPQKVAAWRLLELVTGVWTNGRNQLCTLTATAVRDFYATATALSTHRGFF